MADDLRKQCPCGGGAVPPENVNCMYRLLFEPFRIYPPPSQGGEQLGGSGMVRLSARMSVAGTFATALLVAACASGGGSVAPTGVEKPDLTIAAVPAFDSVGVYVAQERGLFAAQGLHVTTVPVTS